MDRKMTKNQAVSYLNHLDLRSLLCRFPFHLSFFSSPARQRSSHRAPPEALDSDRCRFDAPLLLFLRRALTPFVAAIAPLKRRRRRSSSKLFRRDGIDVAVQHSSKPRLDLRRPVGAASESHSRAETGLQKGGNADALPPTLDLRRGSFRSFCR